MDQTQTEGNFEVIHPEDYNNFDNPNKTAAQYKYFKSPPTKKGFKSSHKEKEFNVKGLSFAEKRLVNMSPALKSKINK